MKHCAKKLLGLAFALALCLAVGGTAFAVEAPEFADVPAALPEQEMLAFEPNVAIAEGTTSTGDIATDGYTVIIPTTVTVDSKDNKGELEVTAQLKQYRTLNITMKPQDGKWTLKYQGAAAGTDTPEVGYQLPQETSAADDWSWIYQHEHNMLSFTTTTMTPSASPEEDMKRVKDFSHTLPITVPHPEQATMSGTYSDTLAFEFALEKLCVTYTINMYGQKLVLNKDGWHNNGYQNYNPVNAVNVVDETTNNVEAGATPDETVTLEYKSHDGTTHTWTRTRPDGAAGEEDARCWEDLAPVQMTPSTDFNAGRKNVTINRNLVRKQYWLDVNGATDYAGGDQDIHGNQGGSISGFVDMQVSADGEEWTDWFWYRAGDDYWGQLPYGIHFKLGFHHVKDGYVYEMGAGGGVKIIANKHVTETEPGVEEGDTTYYVYENTLTGQWTDTDKGKNRYCYIPCYKKGITYFANGGTGGTESVNEDNPPRSNVLYDKTGKLKTPDELDIEPPAGKKFLWWSTKPTYTAGTALYKAEANVSDVNWETYTSAEMSKRPTGDNQKRELYAIWETPYTVKVQFGGVEGWTDWDDANQKFPESEQHGDYYYAPIELGTAYTYDNTSLTLSETENRTVWEALQAKITEEAGKLVNGVPPEDVWQLKDEYTFTTLPANGEVTIQIKRKRYLLNVIPALQKDDGTFTPASDATEAEEYGKFDLDSCGQPQTKGGKVSYYQSMRNYGGRYEIYNVEANPGYRFVGFKRPTTTGPTSAGNGTTNLTDILTGKNDNISYFGDTSGTPYTGDTIYVMFKKDTVTFDYNGGTDPNGKTELVLNYDDTIRFPQVMLTNNTTAGVNFAGWSTKKNPGPGDKIFKLGSEGGDVIPGDTMVSSKVTIWPNENNKVLYAVWRSTTGSDTPATGPSLAPAAKKVLTVRYHANFDPNEELALDLDPNPLLDDMDEDFGFEPEPLPEDVLDPLEDAVKTVTYKPDENVVLRHCMFKRDGYVFVGWNTQPDGTGTLYRVTGVPITDWAVGDTVDLYAQWEKPHHLKPVVDGEPQPGGATPAPTPQPGGADATPAPQPGGVDDAFGIDPHLGGMDDAFGVDPDPQPEGLDDAFGVDPQPEGLDDAFGVDPQPEELDDAFGV